jgi:sugar/nucleoside kinase (ribokinase family)
LGELGFYLRTTTIPRIEVLESIGANLYEWADARVYHPAFQVEVVGTTGAGDAAYAGFLMALLRSLSPYEAVRWACAVGACAVEAVDATSGIRSWEETQARLDNGWKVVDTHLA